MPQLYAKPDLPLMRRALPRAFHWIAWRSGHSLREARRIRKPRIFMYHAVGENDTPAELFAWQLEFLRDEFEIVPLQQLIDRLAQDRATGDEVVITFDDGVRNHATTVYPLLVEHKAPATFFVCPGLMDSGRWIWNMELRIRLRLLSESERTRLAVAVGAVSAEVEPLIQWSKRLSLTERRNLEHTVRSLTREFDPDEELLDRYAPMTWDQAAALEPRVASLGSHTLTHPILTTLGTRDRQREIAESRQLLEARTGRKADIFCYPNGSHDESTVEMARGSYRAALSTRAGFAESGQDLFRLPRIPAGQRAGLFMRRLHHPRA